MATGSQHVVFLAVERFELEEKVFAKEQLWAINKRKKPSEKVQSKRLKPTTEEKKNRSVN